MTGVRYAAFLRGVNVGGKNKVGMAALRAAVEGAGFTEPATYLNSGNVVFTGPRASRASVEDRVFDAIAEAVGFEVPVMVRTEAELDALLAGLPPTWHDDQRQRCYVFFFARDVRGAPEIPHRPEVEDVLPVPGAFVWRIDRANLGRSHIRTFMQTELYASSTSRNLTTVRAVAELARAGDAPGTNRRRRGAGRG
jgi:uncharacterized protein (DUF1697 family)